jgi:hypothetical protein
MISDSAASGAATRKTVWTASMLSLRYACAPPSEAREPTSAAKTAPRIAAPTAPQSAPEKPVVALATTGLHDDRRAAIPTRAAATAAPTGR